MHSSTLRVFRALTLFAVALLPLATPSVDLHAQNATDKRPLSIADYQLWRSISGSQISDNGRWAAWTYTRVRGDDTLHVRALDSDVVYTVPLASRAEFSGDGAWVAYFVSPSLREAEKLERDGDTVTRQAGLLDLATGGVRLWDDASSFGFNEGSSHFFVRKRQSDRDADHEGTDLILRNLREGYEELIGSVYQAEFNDPGTHLAFTVDAADKDGNGLYVIDLETGARRGLDNVRARYARLTWSEDGDALAVLHGEEPEDKRERTNSLVAFTGFERDRPSRFDFAADGEGLNEGWVLSERGSLVWNDDATVVFLATKPQEDELEDWPEDGLPLADVNIWHWADDRIQAAQGSQAGRDRNRTYAAAVHLDDGRFVHLADDRMRTVDVTPNGRWAIGRDDRDYVSDWEPRLADYYRVDTRTGERVTVLEGHLRTIGLSPDREHYL